MNVKHESLSVLVLSLVLCSCTALKSSPATAAECKTLAIKEMSEKRFEDAIVDLTKAATLAPKDSQIYELRAVAYIESKNFADAEKDLHLAISLNPKSSDAYCHMAELKLAAGDKLACVSYANQAIEKNPRNAMAYALRASVKLQQQDSQPGMADLKKSVDFCGSDSRAALFTSVLCVSRQEYALAISCLRKASDVLRAKGNSEAAEKVLAQIEVLSKELKTQNTSRALIQQSYDQANASRQALRDKEQTEQTRIMEEYRASTEKLRQEMRACADRNDRSGIERIRLELDTLTRESQLKLRAMHEQFSSQSSLEEEKQQDAMQSALQKQQEIEHQEKEARKGPVWSRAIGVSR